MTFVCSNVINSVKSAGRCSKYICRTVNCFMTVRLKEFRGASIIEPLSSYFSLVGREKEAK